MVKVVLIEKMHQARFTGGYGSYRMFGTRPAPMPQLQTSGPPIQQHTAEIGPTKPEDGQ